MDFGDVMALIVLVAVLGQYGYMSHIHGCLVELRTEIKNVKDNDIAHLKEDIKMLAEEFKDLREFVLSKV